jgi:hypothetical protein
MSHIKEGGNLIWEEAVLAAKKNAK